MWTITCFVGTPDCNATVSDKNAIETGIRFDQNCMKTEIIECRGEKTHCKNMDKITCFVWPPYCYATGYDRNSFYVAMIEYVGEKLYCKFYETKEIQEE